MGPALLCVDAICEREYGLREKIVILDGDFYRGFVHYLLEIEWGGLNGPAVPVDVSHQVGDTAVEEVGALDVPAAVFLMPMADEIYLQPLVQIGDLFEMGNQ